MNKKISNWSNYPIRETEFVTWNGTLKDDAKKSIPRGMGRCYGDASISDRTISMLKHNLILAFDEEKGIVKCQSGVTLKEVLDVFVPRGWFLPVTPGTKYITVGGALASDVHGKNHHVDGCFGDHVDSIELIQSNGVKMACSAQENQEIFNATRGGMGLTGIVETVTFRLKKIETSFIKQKQIKARSLPEILALFDEYKGHTYSMSWIDCLKGGKGFGRSIMMAGEHASVEDLTHSQRQQPLNTGKGNLINMPINLPSFALNKLSIKAFNALYYAKNTKKEIENVVHYDGFFYPLDSILNWNRMYGKAGFVQYQFVLPLGTSKEGLEEILNQIRIKGWGSFLAVLKLFGKQDSLISFPMEGYTLALDFPIRKGLFEFLDELDKIVLEKGGRIYLSKDARMQSKAFWEGYPNAKKFQSIIRKINPDYRLYSDLFKRLHFN